MQFTEINNLFHDIKRYTVLIDNLKWHKIVYLVIFTPAIWFLISYRFGRWVRCDFNIPVLKTLIKIITLFMHLLICLLTGIDISFQTKIGKGLHISHFGCIIINPLAEIGECCNIGPGLVIGEAGRVKPKGVPIIGNHTYIGVGVKIFGGVRVGNNVAIGANAVVNVDIPDNATVVGIPARIINYNGSNGLIHI